MVLQSNQLAPVGMFPQTSTRLEDMFAKWKHKLMFSNHMSTIFRLSCFKTMPISTSIRLIRYNFTCWFPTFWARPVQGHVGRPSSRCRAGHWMKISHRNPPLLENGTALVAKHHAFRTPAMEHPLGGFTSFESWGWTTEQKPYLG